MTPFMSYATQCFTYTNYTGKILEFSEDEIKYWIEGQETCPKTGKPHGQGYVWFKKAIRLTGLHKRFGSDVWWILSSGSPWTNYKYCSKDGDFKELGTRPKEPKKLKAQEQIPFLEALNAGSVQEGLRVIKEKRPRDFAIHGEAIERNLKRHKSESYVRKYDPSSFLISLQNTNKNLLLYGPSNTGKTHYALAHFENPLLCSHIDDLKRLSPDNDGLVFDDMSFTHWPKEAVIHLLDRDFTRSINVRYGTVEIPADLPKIFTHNSDNPFYSDDITEEQRVAIERRFTRVHVHNKLYI